MTRLAWLYALLLAFAAAWLGWGIAQGGRLQTDLTALLPTDAQVDAVWRAADEAGEKQLNGQILLLVGSEDADRAFAAAEQVADRWQQSGLFAAVDSRLNPDLAQLRQEIRRLGVNALPREQQQLLLHDPAAYFQQRAEDAANPFAAQIVPLEDDWLGFARFVQQKQPSGRLQWHSGNGMMYSEQDGITWVWLRARLPEKAAADQAERLLPLLADSRAQAERGGYRLLAAGGALFAAEAKTQSERESGLMSAIGLTLTFTLLLAVFRSPRVFALVLPLGAGMLLGAAAVVGAFGQIHILTVVIGTSLVGMLVDFPLHWLTPSVFSPDWAAKEAMRRVLPAFLAGLGITATGYLLLAFTPLPVLRQTAVFSVAALGGAFAATVLLLPPLFHGYRPRAARFAAATTARSITIRAVSVVAFLEEEADFFFLTGTERVIHRQPAFAHNLMLFPPFCTQIVHAFGNHAQIGIRLIEHCGNFLMMLAEAFAAAIEALSGKFQGLLPERLLFGVELQFVMQARAEAEVQSRSHAMMARAVVAMVEARTAVTAGFALTAGRAGKNSGG